MEQTLAKMNALKLYGKEIGKMFGTKESAVSQASRRFAQVLDHDKELLKQIEKVRKELGI